ncbi:MAG: DUF3883 domain-containing protein [Gemmatimonadaceae bacterium]|nr:DUF3883 domain-containing protein [Gemmatimonadaceae bacterium]
MLEDEASGRRYSKAEHRRQLGPLLNGRSPQAIEFKHCNVSAALRDLGFPSIDGYKPRSNYQRQLVDELRDQLQRHPSLLDTLTRVASSPAVAPDVRDILSVVVPAPKRERSPDSWHERPTVLVAPGAFAAAEASNRSLGQTGEAFVVAFERARLFAAGQRRLADRVEQVSVTRGDGLGYDVLSYETSGRERLIEVKTTKFSRYTPFLITRNEVRCSEEHAEHYSLYRVFDMRGTPRMFQLDGAVSQTAFLDPVQYLGRAR